jgi:signal transduction histidine kinase
MLKGRGAQIMVSVPSDISLRSYPGALSQIITNLVQNSVKHGFEDYQADAVMTITVKSPKGKADDTPEVVIEFADNGRGIPEAILPRIFDPFFTTKPGEQGGTGLGLNIVYNLVTQKLGGKLQCFSEINVGTRFIMTLPLAIKA